MDFLRVNNSTRRTRCGQEAGTNVYEFHFMYLFTTKSSDREIHLTKLVVLKLQIEILKWLVLM